MEDANSYMQTAVIMEDQVLDLFRELIHERLGIYISREKDYLLKSKLEKLITAGEYKNTGELYSALKKNNDKSLEDLIRYITTTHTFFFREKIHLKILRNDILLRKLDRPLIWCAACATGEEVYSIIIELLEHGIANFLLVATDINSEALRACKRGVYPEIRLREVSDTIKNKYFTEKIVKGVHHFEVVDRLRKYFIIKKLNLIQPGQFEAQFDYIFCRNVLIYFTRKTQGLVIENLLRNLKDLGYLFVGNSESLMFVTDSVESVFTSVYNKKK